MLDQSARMQRLSMLDGKREIPHGDRVWLRVLPPTVRLVVRLGAAALERAGNTGWLTVSQPINRWSESQGRICIRLGPDEWLLLLPVGEAGVVAAELDAALTGQHHALIVSGNGTIGLELTGTAAADILGAGCPLDLGPRHFPVGHGTRTLLGKAEIIVLRLPDVVGASTTLAAYRIECGRSFGRYVYEFLEEAGRPYSTSE